MDRQPGDRKRAETQKQRHRERDSESRVSAGEMRDRERERDERERRSLLAGSAESCTEACNLLQVGCRSKVVTCVKCNCSLLES